MIIKQQSLPRLGIKRLVPKDLGYNTDPSRFHAIGLYIEKLHTNLFRFRAQN